MAYTKKLGAASQSVPTPDWRDWKSSSDFATYLENEQTIRADYQYHPDRLKHQVYSLIDELDASAAGTSSTKTEVDQLHASGVLKADLEKLHAITASANDINQLTGKVIATNVFYAGTTAPEDTKLLWIDTTATTGGLKYYNGSTWVSVPVMFT